MSADRPAVITHGLTKKFGNLTAVDHLDLVVPRGVIYGFLGPNGAGKSTTINMLVGLIPPTSGTAEVGGHSVQDDPLAMKRGIGVVPDGGGLYERLTAVEQIQLVGRLHGLTSEQLAQRVPSLLEALELTDAANKMTIDYSAGMRKKTALAAALVHAPDILFLDEPFESVDPISTRVIKDLLRDMVAQRGATVFFSTHVMELAERFCDEVGIIDHGRLAASGSIAQLRAEAGLPETVPLEELFIHVVQAQGTEERHESLLSWLTEGGNSVG